ncbi:heat shock factor protein isoform X2 [Parasteatoda tepidariorum]|uniref:heat shock factor protein isoform X2 n=1 Tax=Parasteatoda tepidariorum TaxID=114398 RepID=UPI00077F8B67|nr:heat shock factor protein isoform X2 [Parasteatoda tepidariorum]
MRTIEYGTTTHVPAFLTKLWKLVTDESCDELICWSLAGTSFIIYDEIRFSKELLPMYFKHNNMASFVRQLNMYGFRKLSCIDQGGMHCYKNEIEFYHQYFLKGQESLLELIKRKIPNSRTEDPKIKQEYIDELISNIKSLKGKQDSAEQGMRHLKRENRMLWRQVNMLSERYTKQQTVLQQLLPFFVNMVRSSREIALKRKSPLMIDEGEKQQKMARMSPPYYVQLNDQDSNHGMPSSPGNVTNSGPVIHEVTEMENSKMYPGSILCSSNTTTSKECEAIVDSPLSCNLESSEQTIDTPFTEPASMETLNIINQNFESRSRSSSMSSIHSHVSISSLRLPSPNAVPSTSMSPPANISNSSLRLPSPNAMPSPSAIPSSSSRVSSFSALRNIPPTVIIDETTSDVPTISDTLIHSFVPKIEDTCTDSGMYTMDSLMSNRSPSVIAESSASMMSKPAPLLNETTPTLLSQRLLNSEATSMMNAQLPASSSNNGSKFVPSFAPLIKGTGSEMNWMTNQGASSSFAPEQNFDNWLGQIFRTDNLTAGCSLPSANNGTYV